MDARKGKARVRYATRGLHIFVARAWREEYVHVHRDSIVGLRQTVSGKRAAQHRGGWSRSGHDRCVCRGIQHTRVHSTPRALARGAHDRSRKQRTPQRRRCESGGTPSLECLGRQHDDRTVLSSPQQPRQGRGQAACCAGFPCHPVLDGKSGPFLFDDVAVEGGSAVVSLQDKRPRLGRLLHRIRRARARSPIVRRCDTSLRRCTLRESTPRALHRHGR